MLKLYYAPRTRSARPRWLLEELGVPYELVRLDLSKGEHKRAEYLAVHPHGLVPALEDDGRTFMESVAICLHLADKFPEKELAPAPGSLERGEYYQWMVYGVATLEPTLQKIFDNTLLPENERENETATNARKRFDEIAAVLTHAVAGKPFLVGGKLTAADVIVGSLLAWARSMGLLKEQPALESYVKNLTARPAFRRAQT
jgi:glutathione S-transferase